MVQYQPTKHYFTRVIGLFGLTMSGVGSMIGSGWLFSAYFSGQLAGGPGAIFCWLICGAVIMLLALTISELASTFPKSGGMVHYFEFSHGSLASFTLAWANWMGIIASIAAEASASIQYISSWDGPWAKNLYNVDTNSLTSIGILSASSLLIFYFLLNYWSVKLFLHFISVITVFKIIVPIITGIMLIYTGFHPGNFTQVVNTITPYGWESILTAIITCGIILSFNGFQSPVNLAGEAKRPHINLPLAIIFSILITMTVYLHVPRNALWFNLVICFILLLYFRSWVHIVSLISIANIVAFIPGPIVLGSLRRIAPDLSRLFRLPFAHIIASLSFIFLTLFIYWAGWPLTGKVILLLALSLAVYFYYQYKQNWLNFIQQLKSAAWLIIYFLGIIIVSYSGGENFGGMGYISSNVAQLLLVTFALFIYCWAVCSAWRTPTLEAWIQDHHTSNTHYLAN